MTMTRKFLTELLGTALLVFFGVGVATLMFGFKFDGGSVAAGVAATALAFGRAPGPGLRARAHLRRSRQSGGDHGRPPRRPSPLMDALGYWVGQFGVASWSAGAVGDVRYLAPVHTSKTGLGINGCGAATDIHIRVGGAFFAEVVLTALFVFVILGVTSKLGNAHRGAGARPLPHRGPPDRDPDHRDFGEPGPQPRPGPGGRRHALNQVWLFIVAPLLGGVAAAGLHGLFIPGPDPSPAPGSDARPPSHQPRPRQRSSWLRTDDAVVCGDLAREEGH